MSKLRVRGTLVALVLFAAVAVFSGVVQAPSSISVSHKVAAGDSRGTGVLIADGTDPWPPPIPIPWQSEVA